jgi:hypothetical protein
MLKIHLILVTRKLDVSLIDSPVLANAMPTSSGGLNHEALGASGLGKTLAVS